jgi:hypothetical protein
LTGNGGLAFSGTIYAASAATLTGYGRSAPLNALVVVVDTVTLSGNGSLALTYTYTPTLNYPIAPRSRGLTA